ncbi:MAG: acyl carrier protein phosphodiesterase [Saprospiraceae bacterium]|nr:acyl carrier protein phosphodiesterase [Saprospiraceae bacterium]
MNYLSHIFLSGDDIPLMIGNLMTDMITLKEERALSDDLKRGVDLHRDIDALTDGNEIVMGHKRMLYPYFRKYAPVVTDIIYDYLLVLNWNLFSERSFDDLQDVTYTRINNHSELFPSRVRPIIMSMTASRWLEQYRSLPGLDQVFRRLEKKVSFPQSFSEATRILRDNETNWKSDHQQFLGDIIRQLNDLGWIIPQSEAKY